MEKLSGRGDGVGGGGISNQKKNFHGRRMDVFWDTTRKKELVQYQKRLSLTATEYNTREVQLRRGYCTQLRIKWSGFEPYPGT